MSFYKKKVNFLTVIAFVITIAFFSMFLAGIFTKAKSREVEANQVYIDYNYTASLLNLYERNTNAALKYYKNILPYLKNSYIYNEYANILLYAKKFDEAQEFLQKAIKIFPNDKRLYEKLLDVYIIKKEDKKAIDLLKNGSSLFKNKAAIYKRLAILHMRNANYRKAIDYFEKIKDYEQNKEILYYLIQCYKAEGNLNKAVEYAKKLLSFDKSNTDFQELLANLYEQNKQYKKAIAIYKNMNIKEDEKLAAIGNDYYLNGKIDKAFEYFAKAYKIRHNMSYAEKAAYMLMRLGKYKYLINFIDKENVPLSTDRMKYFYGVSLMSIKQYKKAAAVFKKISQSSILYKDALFNEVVCYNKLNMKQKAVETLKSVKNKDKDIYYMLADLYLQYKDYHKAIETIKNNISSFKNKSKAYFYIADIYYDKLKNNSKAVEYLKKSLKADPNNSVVLNYLGYLYIDENIDIKKGVELVKRAVKIQPDNPYYLDSLGWGYYKLGDYKKAEQFLKKAISSKKDKQVKNDVVIYIHLAKVYIKTNSKQKAYQLLKSMVKRFPKNEKVKKLFESLK